MMLRLAIFLFYFLLQVSSFVLAQSNKNEDPDILSAIDSLRQIVSTSSVDTSKINAYFAWDDLIYATDPEQDLAINHAIKDICLEHIGNGLEKNKKWFQKKLTTAYNNLGIIAYQSGQTEKAISYYELALNLHESLGNKEEITLTYNNIGVIYFQLGNYQRAFSYYMDALTIQTKMNDLQGSAKSYNNIGSLYLKMKDFIKAESFYNKSLEIRQQLKDENNIAKTLVNLALISENIADSAMQAKNKKAQHLHTKKAIQRLEKAMVIFDAITDHSNMSLCLNNIGSLYLNQGNIDLAKQYFISGLAYGKKSNNPYRLGNAYNNLSEVALVKKAYDDAIKYGQLGLNKGEETKSLDIIQSAALHLYEAYRAMDKPEDALIQYERYTLLKDSLNGKAGKMALIRSEFKSTLIQHKYLDSINNVKDQELLTLKYQADIESAKQNNYILLLGVIILLIVGTFITYNYYKKRKDNSIIRSEKNTIEIQKTAIEESKKQITDSIEYASHIQNAILPSEDQMTNLFKDSFLVYKPKDILAGDFYWLNTTKQSKNLIHFAVADCTGHGVPGALVSIVCATALNQTIKEFPEASPELILNHVTISVLQTFSSNSANKINDGMDIAFCTFDKIHKKLYFSGANSNLYIVRDGDLQIYKGSRRPIGKYHGTRPFNLDIIDLKPNDMIYLLSDGIPDQFGDLEKGGKKYGYKRLRELLLRTTLVCLALS